MNFLYLYRLHLPEDTAIIVTQELSLASLIKLPEPDEMIQFGTRVGTGGAAGAFTTVIVANIMAKLYAKGVVKLAIQPLTKIFVSRAALIGIGALAGGGVGSAIPGLGTVIGIGVGAVVGIAGGVAVDYGLLKLEEHLSRDNFREQLTSAIREAREGILENHAEMVELETQPQTP